MRRTGFRPGPPFPRSSKFGQVQPGLPDASNPTSLTTNLDYKYLYGGTLDTNVQSTTPVGLGGRGNLVGSYNSIGTLFLGIYGNWKF